MPICRSCADSDAMIMINKNVSSLVAEGRGETMTSLLPVVARPSVKRVEYCV